MKAKKTEPSHATYGAMRRHVAVCFHCRKGWKKGRLNPACPECGEPLRSMGDRLRIPPTHKVKAWRRLREATAKRAACRAVRQFKDLVRDILSRCD